MFRIALANLPFPESPDDAIARTRDAVAQAGREHADLICFPECYVPGYRAAGKRVPPPDPAFLERAWSAVAEAAGRATVAVVLGTERVGGDGRSSPRSSSIATARSRASRTRSDRSVRGGHVRAGVRPARVHGGHRHVRRRRSATRAGAIPRRCAGPARRGAQIVFHPHFHEAEPGSYRPTTFADPANTFHEKAALCRAAENTCYFATVNYASAGSPTTSAIVRPGRDAARVPARTARQDCSSPTSISRRRRVCSPRG